MKIRTGFITNSSSTNFLIISRKELTEDYLFEKLGFIADGQLAEQGHMLCEEIISGIDRGGLRYFDYDTPTYENVKEIFGPRAAERFKRIPGAHVYWGYTSSDQTPMTQFFTTDSFEVEEKDFYINGRSCVW